MKSNPIQLATESTCTGCLACFDSCKFGAINIYEKYNHKFVSIDKNKCTKCGLCVKACPVISFKNKNTIVHSSVFGGWSTDYKLRQRTASGGACSEFSKYMLNNAGYVAGATLFDNTVNHIIVNGIEEYEKFLNSKYIQSNTQNIYIQTRKLLAQKEKVLFIGTPCQIAGLYCFLGQKEYPSLITVDLICSAPPSKEALQIQLNMVNAESIIRFRDKSRNGWGHDHDIVVNKKDSIYTCASNEDYFYKIFASCLTARKACLNCQFSTIPRVADITVGDFWGQGNIKGAEMGMSLIIANNEKGLDFVKKIDGLFLIESSWEKAIKSNPRLHYGKDFLRYHPAITFRGFFNRIPQKIRLKLLLNKMPYKLVWGIFKVVTKINIKLHTRRSLKITNQA